MPYADPEERKAYRRRYYAANKQRIMAQNKASNKRCERKPFKKRPQDMRKSNLKRKYGITLEQFNAYMLIQNGVCGICGNPPPVNENLHVDHCHATGKIRGLLCKSCNWALGHFRDNPELMRKAALWVS